MKSLLYVLKYNIFLWLTMSITVITIFSCEKETEVAGFDVMQTERLLRADSTKTWLRTSRNEGGKSVALVDCTLESTLIFSISEVDTIPNPFLFQSSCGDTLLFGGWFAKNDFGGHSTDSLLYLINPDTIRTIDTTYVDYDTLYNIIENITSQFMTISKMDTTSGVSVSIKEKFEAK